MNVDCLKVKGGCFSHITMLDGPRSNMVYSYVVWLVLLLTMLGDSFLTWLDVKSLINREILLLTMLGESFPNIVRFHCLDCFD